MNKQLITLVFSTIILLGSGGCVGALWYEHDGLITKKTQEQKILDDKIIAFGQASSDTAQVARGSLVMMGQQLWYVIPPDQTKSVIKILKTKLPKPFGIMHYRGITAEVIDNKSQFSADLDLTYKPKTEEEKAKILALGFKEDSYTNRKNPKETIHYYRKNLKVTGNYYKANQSVAVEYQFENPIKLYLYENIEITETHFAATAGRVIATPVALAADVVFVPFTIMIAPFMKFPF